MIQQLSNQNANNYRAIEPLKMNFNNYTIRNVAFERIPNVNVSLYFLMLSIRS